jgi:hypothetical protein
MKLSDPEWDAGLELTFCYQLQEQAYRKYRIDGRSVV